MRQSQFIIKTLNQPPHDADTINHKLLVQAGFVRQVMAGVYTYLPLGLKVLNNISQAVREEMGKLGSQEILMPILHPANLWKQSGGWDHVDVLFKIKSRTGKDYALAQSNEETVTPLVKEAIHSYRDLPISVYHIQWKYRDELRAKSGILRGREFYMKDLYSFHADQEDFENYYQKAKDSYLNIYKKLGLTAKVTEASGGSFSDKISYEFEVLTDAGEANILYCDSCDFCVNIDDIQTYNEADECPRCKSDKLKPAKASEVGNVFDLGQKYTKAFEVTFVDQDGNKKFPIMGCYGFGISRTMGVIVEKFHDQKGIVWPESIAPFLVHLIELPGAKNAGEIYEKLNQVGVEVLWDDRDLSAGAKFTDADLIGIPYRLVVSEKTGDKIEVKKRNEDKTELISMGDLLHRFSNKY